MRAQLRTYHAIPSLQAHQDPHAYKQLQDAPRLKSILKGGAEDRPEPQSLEAIKMARIPRTNPVNLLFVICQSAAKIAELHFPPGREFHDLIMKTNLTSQSRAMAFLWIMWFYLESDFTEEGCDENPFGPGVDYGVDVANQG
jgi:Ino eighty subunit 1